MILTITEEMISGPFGAYRGPVFSASDVIIIDDDVTSIMFNGPLQARVFITHRGTGVSVKGPAVIGKNNLGGRSVFMSGLITSGLNSFGDLIIKGDLQILDLDGFVNNGDLIIDGNMTAAADVTIPNGCCAISGNVFGDGMLACDNVWIRKRADRASPSITRRFRSAMALMAEMLHNG